MAQLLVKLVQATIVLSGLYFSLPISLALSLISPSRSYSSFTPEPSLNTDFYSRSQLAAIAESKIIQNDLLGRSSHLGSSVNSVSDSLKFSLVSDSHQSDHATLQPTHIEIHLNRREVVLYSGQIEIKKYPIAVGRRGWETPTGEFKVTQLLHNPTWIHPLTGESVPAGHPDNPLGSYWIGFWTDGRNWVGFHGTPDPESIGRAASHGCIRMYNQDIEELFYQVRLEMPVVVKQ